MNNEKKIEIPAMPEKYRLITADERMRRTRSQLRRAAKIAMGYITE